MVLKNLSLRKTYLAQLKKIMLILVFSASERKLIYFKKVLLIKEKCYVPKFKLFFNHLKLIEIKQNKFERVLEVLVKTSQLLDFTFWG